MARLLFCLLWCTASLPRARAHSWLACVDWDECSNTCHGYARNWHKQPSNPFGTDVGRDIRPGADVPQGLFCDPNKEGSSDQVEERYSQLYPMATVRAGQKLVLQWPAKNHADVGVQRRVQLFISNGPDLGDNFSQVISKADWVQRYPELEQTFSNCFVDGKRVSSGVDKAVCSGTFTLPSHLQPGIYTFMWWWEFNGGEFYNSCADVIVTSTGTRPTCMPPTTRLPTSGPPIACGGPWAQCGGRGWNGAICCVSGYTCQEYNPYYAQCVPGTSPTTAPPTVTVTTTSSTTTSSTLNVGECKPFCAQSSDSWSFKCSWDCCGGCPSCATMTASSTATVTTTSTTTLTTTGTTTTATDQAGSTTPLPRVCKSWCAGRAQPWAKKCRWEKCGGCAECGPPGRRLAAEREHLNDSFFV